MPTKPPKAKFKATDDIFCQRQTPLEFTQIKNVFDRHQFLGQLGVFWCTVLIFVSRSVAHQLTKF